MNLIQRIRDLIGFDRKDAVEFSPELMAAIKLNGGTEVSWETALQVSTVLRCAAIISEDLCSVPWKIMRDESGGRKVEDKDHQLYNLITYGPNDWQTSFEFRKTIGLHLALCGNAYVYINKVQRRSGDKIVEMIPYEPSKVHVCRKSDWSIEYRLYDHNGNETVATSRNVWHLKNHSWNSYKGLSALAYAREAIGLARDIESDQRSTHKNFARPSGVLTVNQDLDPKQFEIYRRLIDKQVETRLRLGLPMVVDKNTEWKQMSYTAVEAQTIENRGFQIEEVCRDMGVLPIMVGYTGDKGSTYASAEQMFLHHYKSCTRVWHQNFQESADRWLLSEQDRRNGYYSHLVDLALLRGDSKSRGEFYRLMWMIGAMTGNEIRAFEDMDRKDGLDFTWAPLANAPIGDDGMPMLADVQSDIATVDNNLKQGDPEDFIKAFQAASPAAQVRFMSVLRGRIKPEEGEENL